MKMNKQNEKKNKRTKKNRARTHKNTDRQTHTHAHQQCHTVPWGTSPSVCAAADFWRFVLNSIINFNNRFYFKLKI